MLTTATQSDLLTVLPTTNLGHVPAEYCRVSVGDVRFVVLHMQVTLDVLRDAV